MPKAIQYTKGSIIYFSGDKDERIFILQKGLVVLTSIDVETNSPVTEQVKNGEFFGVKSALGHFPREETATVLHDTVAVSLTVQEFEQIFSSNKQVIMKMLRVFSSQLRMMHKKTESLLESKKADEESQTPGMVAVAKSFYEDEQYRACCDICKKFLMLFPDAPEKMSVAKLYQDSKLRFDKISELKSKNSNYQSSSKEGALKQFQLPAFERFAKHYENEEVIISEFEVGDSFYLIQSGQVQLVKLVNGAKKNLDILKPGEFFGEMAILDNSKRSATCMALGDVECLEFNKENFELLVTGNPQIAIILLKLFCKRIYDQKRRLKILVIKEPQVRIADVFQMLDEMNPVVNANERQRKFNVTIADIAHWTGFTPEVTRDEINRLVEKHKIEVYDNYVIVTNIADMKRLVDSRTSVNEAR